MSKNFMETAIEAAEEAFKRDEIPVGAVVVKGRAIIAIEGNRIEELNDPTAHAEILAIRKACHRMGMMRLNECDLYVTLEPCPMCAQAISFARIRRVYYGAPGEKSGGIDNGARIFDHKSCHHKPEIYAGISEEKSSKLLKNFFRQKRIK